MSKTKGPGALILVCFVSCASHASQYEDDLRPLLGCLRSLNAAVFASARDRRTGVHQLWADTPEAHPDQRTVVLPGRRGGQTGFYLLNPSTYFSHFIACPNSSERRDEQARSLDGDAINRFRSALVSQIREMDLSETALRDSVAGYLRNHPSTPVDTALQRVAREIRNTLNACEIVDAVLVRTKLETLDRLQSRIGTER